MSEEKRCTCGSGGHPRECKLHPLNFFVHSAELSLWGIIDNKEMTDTEKQRNVGDILQILARNVRTRTLMVIEDAIQELLDADVDAWVAATAEQLDG